MVCPLLVTTGDGFDIILDSDSQGSIEFDGNTLAGGDQYGDNRVHKDANNHIYVQVDANTLIIDGNIMVKNYTDGSNALGLTMGGPVAEPALPATTRDIKGDFEPIDFDATKDGIQTQKDDLGNTILDPAKPYTRNDNLFGSSGNDHITSGDSGVGYNSRYGYSSDTTDVFDNIGASLNVDAILGKAGDDVIESGAGNDYVDGGAGKDVLAGGAGKDYLIGGAGDDILFGIAANDAVYENDFERKVA